MNMKKEKDFYQVSLKVIMKNTAGEILLLEADPGGSFAGFYDLPGGRIDTDEFTTPFEEIINREIAEEIGAVSFALNPVPVAMGRHLVPAARSRNGKDIRVLYLFFEAIYQGGDVIISKEHIGFHWIDLTQHNPRQFLISGNLEGIQMYLSKSSL